LDINRLHSNNELREDRTTIELNVSLDINRLQCNKDIREDITTIELNAFDFLT
jgi:hypothetical protein